MSAHPRFLSIEGIDFCGKSTQVARLMQRLAAAGRPVHLLREPGGTAISERIRDLLLDNRHAEMDPRAEILLFSAARAQLVAESILPLLDGGHLVLADRFFDSTTAYQGHGHRLDIDFVMRLNRFATRDLRPGRTLLLDIPVAESVRRRQAAGRGRDRMEQGDADFFARIREGYLAIAREEPDRVTVIDGARDIDAVAADVWAAVCELWDL